MTTKWKNNKVAENSGVLFVQNVINDCKGIFNKVDGSNDVGIDGYVEFVQNESVTGLCIGVQVKSGDTYQDKNGDYAIIKSDKPHFSAVVGVREVDFVPEHSPTTVRKRKGIG